MASAAAAGRHSPVHDRPSMSDLRIVLLGKNGSENSRVGNIILGRAAFHSKAPSHSQHLGVRISEAVEGKNITVINTHLLQPNLLQYQIIEGVRECVSLSAPGPHVFILILQYKNFNENDRQSVKYLLNLFSYQAMKHTIVVTTDDEPRGYKYILKNVCINKAIHNLIQECEGRHLKFDTSNPGWCFELLRRIENVLKEEHEEFLICNKYDDGGDGTSVDEDQSRFLGSDREDKEVKVSDHKESTKTGRDGGVTTTGKTNLNIVLCGNDSDLKNSVSKMFRGTMNKPMNKSEKEECKVCVKKDGMIHGQQISVIELPVLTQLSEEEEIRQTHRCVSLCHPGVHVFILIIPDAPLNNEDRAEIEEIQRIFSSRINKHIMILIKQNSEHQTAELNEETQSVIESFGGRHQFIGPNTQVSVLMEKLEQMVEENSGVCFSTETLMETQMEKLLKFEEMKKKIHLLQKQDSRDREDELRIVLLGKTGVGKSSTGNTILGREAFISDIFQTSVTEECQKETAEINSRHITVIDTPGLFDTDLNNEEIQREMSNCISMILPGPHVFLLLIPVGRFTQEEAKSVKIIQETFGENSLMYTIVLFTNGDKLKNKTIEQFLGEPGSPLNQLIEACGNRFHVFNNETGDQTQVTDLLQKIDNMVKANGGSYYSCKMFREMEKEKQEKQIKIMMEKVEQVIREKEVLMNKHKEEKKKMKMMMEKEIQSNDKERKRREEEFREREEQYKREIKDREEQERNIREELKREREECEKQKQLERQRSEEEEERRRKKEKETWDEYDQRLKQEKERSQREKVDFQAKHEEEKERMEREKEVIQFKHGEEIKRMKMMMDEERQNHDKERKRREEEFKEREEQYKTEMKREQEKWEKQKQEAIQRGEEEEKWRKREQAMWDEYNQRLQQDIERMKIMLEKERQNHDKERKRIEEDNERRKKEQETWDKYYEKLKQEIERMKIMMEEERQNHDKERKRREEEDEKKKKEQATWVEYYEKLKQEIEIMNIKIDEERENHDKERKRRGI